MTTSPSPRRTPALAAVLVAAALAVSACGGGDADATDKPSTSPSTDTSVPTPTPTTTPTATPTPLSPFEEKAPVKALRAWADAEAKAVNAGEQSMATLAPLTTARGLDLTRTFAADDIAHGYRLPGPHPFTPVSVQTRGAVAKVSACLLLRGWSVRPKSGKPVRKREVVPAVFEMDKAGGAWKLDRYYAGTADCSGVRLQEVRW